MITTTEVLNVKDLKSDVKPIWCPGCGDYGVYNALLKVMTELSLDPTYVVIASGIGCSGRFPAFVNAYGFHGVHGRVLPLATGIKTANPELTVFAVGGDGDAFSIGAGHLPHAARRNVDLTYVVMDNEIYGLTKGQPSPTSPVGMEKKVAPYGTYDIPLNPIAMALSYGTTFVARGFSSQPRQLVELISRGVQHNGFSFIQVMSPCVAFFDTYAHFKDVVAPIPEDHDPSDRMAAMRLAMETDNMYVGVFYESDRLSHHTQVKHVQEESGGGFSLEKILEHFTR